MVLSNKAQVSILAFMIGVVILILALAWIFPINQITTMSMSNSSTIGGMDCNNSSISDYTKATCWIVDIGQNYFIGGIIALAGIIFAAKIIGG